MPLGVLLTAISSGVEKSIKGEDPVTSPGVYSDFVMEPPLCGDSRHPSGDIEDEVVSFRCDSHRLRRSASDAAGDTMPEGGPVPHKQG